MNVAVATQMTVDEIGLALAIYCKLHRVEPGAARRHLDPTPRACFNEAVAWTGSNASVVKRIKDDPESIAMQAYSLSPARSWLARTLGLGRAKDVGSADDDELASVMKEIVVKQQSKQKKKRKDYDSIRALVEESLDEA